MKYVLALVILICLDSLFNVIKFSDGPSFIYLPLIQVSFQMKASVVANVLEAGISKPQHNKQHTTLKLST